MNRITFTRFRRLDYGCKEAINTLCTNLGFLGRDKRIIMFTSVDAHDGKSFITMNTMRTLAQLGHSVALVDADLRRSQLVGDYGVRMKGGRGCGLAHYLAGRCEMEDALYETDIPKADLLPVGYEVSNSLTLLNSPRFAQMLSRLRERYDYVLVDAPPVGVVIDAAKIAKSCDGVIFVVKHNFTDRRDLLDAKQQIEQAGCEVLGAVLNDVDLESLSNRKYYSKKYYNHYNPDYAKPAKERRSGKMRPLSDDKPED